MCSVECHGKQSTQLSQAGKMGQKLETDESEACRRLQAARRTANILLSTALIKAAPLDSAASLAAKLGCFLRPQHRRLRHRRLLPPPRRRNPLHFPPRVHALTPRMLPWPPNPTITTLLFLENMLSSFMHGHYSRSVAYTYYLYHLWPTSVRDSLEALICTECDPVPWSRKASGKFGEGIREWHTTA